MRYPVLVLVASVLILSRQVAAFIPPTPRHARLIQPLGTVESGATTRGSAAASYTPRTRLQAVESLDPLEAAGTQIVEFAKTFNYGSVFSASLFPYLLFLKNIWKLEDNPQLPSAAKWGFASLLIFVVSTIIGGIFCKVVYNEQLANIDYVHGIAESLLGVTNITLAIVFARALQAARKENGGARPERWR